jgi:tRNA G18 (ribose-2'-O)-methylase SpoU
VRKLKLQELGRLSAEEFQEAEKLPYVVVLDNVRSMHNVGSVFRTADAFRAEKIFLCGITATPPHREIRKTAIGAERSVLWEYEKNSADCVNKLKAAGYRILGVEQTDKSLPLQDIKTDSGKVAFVFGNEIDGISAEVLEICHGCIEIPQAGTKHSLNISVACGIVLWQYVAPRLPRLVR